MTRLEIDAMTNSFFHIESSAIIVAEGFSTI